MRTGGRVNSMRPNVSDFIAMTVSDFVSPLRRGTSSLSEDQDLHSLENIVFRVEVWAQLLLGVVVWAWIGGSFLSFFFSTEGYTSHGQAGEQTETKLLSGHRGYNAIAVAAWDRLSKNLTCSYSMPLQGTCRMGPTSAGCPPCDKSTRASGTWGGRYRLPIASEHRRLQVSSQEDLASW